MLGDAFEIDMNYKTYRCMSGEEIKGMGTGFLSRLLGVVFLFALLLTVSPVKAMDVAVSVAGGKSDCVLPTVDSDKIIPKGIVALLKDFYVRQTSLAWDYADLFAEDVRDRNDFRFEVFKEIQRQRGTYDLLRSAKVSTRGLGFELVEMDGSFARVRVFGTYRVTVGDFVSNLEEDSTFVVSKTANGWRIVELEGEEGF